MCECEKGEQKHVYPLKSSRELKHLRPGGLRNVRLRSLEVAHAHTLCVLALNKPDGDDVGRGAKERGEQRLAKGRDHTRNGVGAIERMTDRHREEDPGRARWKQ